MLERPGRLKRDDIRRMGVDKLRSVLIRPNVLAELSVRAGFGDKEAMRIVNAVDEMVDSLEEEG